MTFPRNIATLALLGCLAACATGPPSPQDVLGKYELRGKGIYAGESFELLDGTFIYSRFSDSLDDPSIQGMPVRGRYTLSGNTIVFHHPRVIYPQRTLERRLGRFTLWTPRQLTERAKTGKTPGDILYQSR